jgi:hypothetical protein
MGKENNLSVESTPNLTEFLRLGSREIHLPDLGDRLSKELSECINPVARTGAMYQRPL